MLFTSYDFANRPLTTGEATATFSTLDPNAAQAFESTTGNWITLNHYDKKPSTSAFPWSLAAFAADITGVTMSNAFDLQDNLLTTQATVGSASFYHWYTYDGVGRPWHVYTNTASTKPMSPVVTYFHTPSGMVASLAFLGGASLPTAYTIRD